MKIDQSTIAMQSQHTSLSLRTSHTTLRAWVGHQRPDFEGQNSMTGVSVSLSSAARAMVTMPAQPLVPSGKTDSVTSMDDGVPIDSRLRLLMNMIEVITGRAVKVFDARTLQAQPDMQVSTPSAAATDSTQSMQPTQAGWGMELDTHESMTELETTQVSASGVVQTADGKQINFSLQLDMSRAYVEENSTSIRSGDAVRQDPLVINFAGNSVELADTQFSFDLNADGNQETIAFVTGGSGFLALDKNGDGHINDGTELFGTRSGDGFADLAKFDQDGNHWIDENDAVYSQLRVWQKDASGQDTLSSLSSSGVGALYLGRVASPFSVNTATNQTLGRVRSTGLFLYESGQAGSLQQVDL